MSSGETRETSRDERRARRDLVAIGEGWRDRLSLDQLVTSRWPADAPAGPFDVLAVGKAALPMLDALASARIEIRRQLVVTTRDAGAAAGAVVGDHPVPGAASEAAGRAIGAFLDAGALEVPTLVLLSGGASSLAVDFIAPARREDVGEVWDRVLAQGVDISTLNRIRASVSRLGGGMLARRVRSRDLVVMTMVDNVVSGAEWVGSGPATEFRGDAAWLDAQLRTLGVADSIVTRWVSATRMRQVLMAEPLGTRVRHVTVAEPRDLLQDVSRTAATLGYRFIDLGAAITEDVADVASRVCREVTAATTPLVVAGLGEVSVRTEGAGRGGRCQEFVLWCARWLEDAAPSSAMVMAVATDGQDHLAGVGGAWADATTSARARARGVDVSIALASHDSHHVLSALGQLLDGGATGWNLCDLYLGLVRPSASRTTLASAID